MESEWTLAEWYKGCPIEHRPDLGRRGYRSVYHDYSDGNGEISSSIHHSPDGARQKIQQLHKAFGSNIRVQEDEYESWSKANQPVDDRKTFRLYPPFNEVWDMLKGRHPDQTDQWIFNELLRKEGLRLRYGKTNTDLLSSIDAKTADAAQKLAALEKELRAVRTLVSPQGVEPGQIKSALKDLGLTSAAIGGEDDPAAV